MASSSKYGENKNKTDHASKLILGEKIYEKAESYMVAHDKDGERCLVDPQMFLQV